MRDGVTVTVAGAHLKDVRSRLLVFVGPHLQQVSGVAKVSRPPVVRHIPVAV